MKGIGVLVDAGDYSLMAPVGSQFRPDGYVPPPNIVYQLSQIGITPKKVANLVITHAHWDHYAGTTSKDSAGRHVPTFPNANHYLGKADWDSEKVQKALEDKNSNDSRTFGVLNRAGLLHLVEKKVDISSNIQIIPFPGESPGHQIVRLSSGSKILYCIGDLFHHPTEVEHLTWMAKWDDPEVMLKSRKGFIQTALSEDATVLAGHMPAGKLEKTSSGARFVEIPIDSM
jgi:glyoxylase-like metal-dependent hydrolase (beta-lactamase superfamily II)